MNRKKVKPTPRLLILLLETTNKLKQVALSMADGCKHFPHHHLGVRQCKAVCWGSCLSPACSVNVIRALRVTELLQDYHGIQTKIAQYQANPKPDEYNEIGFTTLRQCHSEARTLLKAPFPPEMLHPPTGADEAAKRQLQR